jgi:hypothetical protein
MVAFIYKGGKYSPRYSARKNFVGIWCEGGLKHVFNVFNVLLSTFLKKTGPSYEFIGEVILKINIV